MSPGRWIRQRRASNNQQDPGTVEGIMEEELIPGGQSEDCHRKAINKKLYCFPFESAMEKKEMICGG